jgi:hypothetical protein
VDATLRKCREASFFGADGVVNHTKTLLVSDHPVCGAKVGFAEIFLMPQPPFLTRRGNNAFIIIFNLYDEPAETVRYRLSTATAATPRRATL